VKAGAGKPLAAFRRLSQWCVGGGVRLVGENAADLTLALGGAMGLRWLESVGETAHLRTQLANRQASVVQALEAALYEGTRAWPSWAPLSGLLRDHWGSFLPQDTFVEFLRAQGIAVPGVFL